MKGGNMNIYEQFPAKKPIPCPKLSHASDTSYAPRPLSACAGCPYLSYMTCSLGQETPERTVQAEQNL